MEHPLDSKNLLHTHTHIYIEVILTQAFSWQKRRWPIFTKGNNHRERESGKKKIPLREIWREDKGAGEDSFSFGLKLPALLLFSVNVSTCEERSRRKWRAEIKEEHPSCVLLPRGKLCVSEEKDPLVQTFSLKSYYEATFSKPLQLIRRFKLYGLENHREPRQLTDFYKKIQNMWWCLILFQPHVLKHF